MNEEYRRVCECCGRLVLEPFATMTKTGFVCEKCLDEYGRCSVCNELVPIDDLLDVQGEAYVCEDCLSTPLFKLCAGCGQITFVDDLVDDLCPYCVTWDESKDEKSSADFSGDVQ